ncbi:unnamed protein product [Protopolystoma xenopodis]|uniref:Uncharacterized protein n=1 Tax=Protopolystoma xenopodis TaxID=117903 RepID=A0A3S5CN45_9PLAT|nr:unnamed protein product [Protopolystoma xenopodis]
MFLLIFPSGLQVNKRPRTFVQASLAPKMLVSPQATQYRGTAVAGFHTLLWVVSAGLTGELKPASTPHRVGVDWICSRAWQRDCGAKLAYAPV